MSSLFLLLSEGRCGEAGRPAGVGDGGSSSRNQGGDALPLARVIVGVVAVVKEQGTMDMTRSSISQTNTPANVGSEPQKQR